MRAIVLLSVLCALLCGVIAATPPAAASSVASESASPQSVLPQSGAAGDAPRCESGQVFVDGNGNGRRDRGEAPVVGARVSDGEHIVATDAAGRYRLAAPAGGRLFLVKPAGYRAASRVDGLPDTWRDAASAGCRDFALRRDVRAPGEPLDVLLFGDPQPKSPADVDYYERDIVAPLRSRVGATMALSLGDIVSDNASLYPVLKRVDASLGVPWLHVAGNHDVDPGAVDDQHSLAAFHEAFGADTMAWEEERANFVLLDDVVVNPGNGGPGAGKPYIGGLREDQFRFLEAYLAGADRSRLLVIALHIPLFDVAGVEIFRHADRARLFALLSPFPHVLLLSAHTHAQQHVFHGADEGWIGANPLHEYNVGASCGAFWTGVRDADGIPDTTMADGTPNGYARMRVAADSSVALRWFAARAPADAQIGLHSPGVIRRGAYPGYAVYANVWMGQADTVAEYRVDGGAWKPMARVLQPDPAYVAEVVRDDAADALRGFDRVPEAVPSAHLWRGALPTDVALGKHRVEVRAQVDGFGLATAETQYRLADPVP